MPIMSHMRLNNFLWFQQKKMILLKNLGYEQIISDFARKKNEKIMMFKA
jgi:hypothetical protein